MSLENTAKFEGKPNDRGGERLTLSVDIFIPRASLLVRLKVHNVSLFNFDSCSSSLIYCRLFIQYLNPLLVNCFLGFRLMFCWVPIYNRGWFNITTTVPECHKHALSESCTYQMYFLFKCFCVQSAGIFSFSRATAMTLSFSFSLVSLIYPHQVSKQANASFCERRNAVLRPKDKFYKQACVPANKQTQSCL